MPNQHGEFIWYELMTSDADAAAGFYGDVVGWRSRDAGMGANDYRLFSMNGTDIAGLMPFNTEMCGTDTGPCWMGYVGVDDVDAAASDIVKAGGSQHVPPTDILGVGRFAMLADPHGTAFYVMRGNSEEASTAFSPDRTGHCHWNELSATDPAGALAFYGGRFGWQKGEAMPMGEMGTYQIIEQGGKAFGAMMPTMEGAPPMWRFYFGVEDIDAADTIVRDKGGTVHHGPAEVPGGAFIVIASDPQGAMFGLVGPRKQQGAA